MMRDESPFPSLAPASQAQKAAVKAVVFAAMEDANRSRVPRLSFIGATATLVAVALALVAGGPLGSGAAAWSAVPETPAAAAAQQLAAACEKAIAAASFPIAVRAATPALAETRGTSSAVLSVGSDQLHLCVSGPTHSFQSVISSGSLPSGAIGAVEYVDGYRTGGDPLRVLVARVSSEVAGPVTVDTSDGLKVTATLDHGLALAWWPSNADAISVAVTRIDGSRVSIPVPEQAPPAPATARP